MCTVGGNTPGEGENCSVLLWVSHGQQLKGSPGCSGMLTGSPASSGYLPCHGESTELILGLQWIAIVPKRCHAWPQRYSR